MRTVTTICAVFPRESGGRQMKYGVEAITCYLHACRQQNESKSRKYLAKVIYNISSFFFFFSFFYNYFLRFTTISFRFCGC